jgi:hypothetical protein
VRHAVRGLARLAPGVYLDQAGLHAEQAHRLRAHAVLDRVGGTAASHVTAAVLLGLPVMRDDLASVHLSVLEGRRGGAKRGAGHVIHCAPVTADEVVLRGGLPVTAAARTAIDCARRFDLDRGVMIADAALHHGLTTIEALALAGQAARGRGGARRAGLVAGLASGLAESPGESLLRLRLVGFGLDPAEQVALPGIPGSPRVDFLVDAWQVIEFDGEAKYVIDGDPARAHWEEKLRHDRLVEAGYDVLRITWADLWDVAALRRRVMQARERARRRHP